MVEGLTIDSDLLHLFNINWTAGVIPDKLKKKLVCGNCESKFMATMKVALAQNGCHCPKCGAKNNGIQA